MRRFASWIDVRPTIANRAKGRLTVGRTSLVCALGPAGVRVDKREGDGATPLARLLVRRLWRRADRTARPPTGLPVQTISRRDGWCDAAGHRRYNRLVPLPFSASHEVLQRADGLYDLVLELGWNDRPVRRGRGSAIFLHAARLGFPPTQGCIAVAPSALGRLAAWIGPQTVLRVGAVKPVKRFCVPNAMARRPRRVGTPQSNEDVSTSARSRTCARLPARPYSGSRGAAAVLGASRDPVL